MDGNSARADLEALEGLYEVVDTLMALDAERLHLAAPKVSGWPVERHLAHVALANELVLRNLKSLASGEGLLLRRGGEPMPEAAELLRAGYLPRGRAESPRMVRPPERVDRAMLAGWLADNRSEIAELRERTLEPADPELRIPHQLLGPLDLFQWARFAAVHTRHHLAIALEVLAAAAPDAELPPLPGIEPKK